MRKGRFFFVTMFAVSAALAIAACTIVDGLTLPGTNPNGGSDAARDAADIDSDPCGTPGYPVFSTTSTSTPNDPIQFLVAINKLDFGAGSDAGLGGPFGYNLDHVCTCPQQKSCTSNYPDCDQPNTGADNAISGLINGQAAASGFDVTALTQKGLDQGKNGLLIQILEYNGLPDDSFVAVNFFGSTGTVVQTNDAGPADASYDSAAPLFNANDKWSVTQGSVLNPTELDPAKYIAVTQAANAYVANGTLVALMDAIDVPLAPNVSVHLSDVAVTGQISGSGDAGGYSLRNGVVVGRWAVADAIENIGNIYLNNGTPSGYVCTLGLIYDEIRGQICDAVDISAIKSLDNSGSPCNALSVGLRFESVPATLGPILPFDAGLTPCIAPEGGSTTCL